MGRRRKPAEEQALKGNPGKRALVIAPPAMLPVLEVPPPDELSSDARAVWLLVAPDLIAMKILRRSDALTFGIFCESFARYARALVAVNREGDVQWVKTVSGDKMKRINPRVRILDSERDVVLKYAEKFGLTPIDRFRVVQVLAGPGAALDTSAPRAPIGEEEQLDLGPGALPYQGPLGYLS